jgi:hypothetical protein
LEAVVGAGLLDVGGGGLTQFDATVLGVPVGDAGQRSVVGLVEGGLLAGELGDEDAVGGCGDPGVVGFPS